MAVDEIGRPAEGGLERRELGRDLGRERRPVEAAEGRAAHQGGERQESAGPRRLEGR